MDHSGFHNGSPSRHSASDQLDAAQAQRSRPGPPGAQYSTPTGSGPLEDGTFSDGSKPDGDGMGSGGIYGGYTVGPGGGCC